jgi:hypothetical protein
VHDAPPIASASTSAPAQGAGPADDGDDDDDGDGDIWDPPDYTARAAGGGLSVAVSAMAAPAPSAEEDGQRPLHALALGGDAGALRAYLDAHPGAGVDELDDYVRILSTRGKGRADACRRVTRRCTWRATVGTSTSHGCCSSAARTGLYPCVVPRMRSAARSRRRSQDADDLTALELAQVAGRTEVEALFQ